MCSSDPVLVQPFRAIHNPYGQIIFDKITTEDYSRAGPSGFPVNLTKSCFTYISTDCARPFYEGLNRMMIRYIYIYIYIDTPIKGEPAPMAERSKA